MVVEAVGGPNESVAGAARQHHGTTQGECDVYLGLADEVVLIVQNRPNCWRRASGVGDDRVDLAPGAVPAASDQAPADESAHAERDAIGAQRARSHLRPAVKVRAVGAAATD